MQTPEPRPAVHRTEPPLAKPEARGRGAATTAFRQTTIAYDVAVSRPVSDDVDDVEWPGPEPPRRQLQLEAFFRRSVAPATTAAQQQQLTREASA